MSAPLNAQLKPCPFCGGVARVRNGKRWFCQLHGDAHDPKIIHCDSKNCEVSPSVTAQMGDAVGSAVTKWNFRPIEDAQAARIAELEAALSIKNASYQIDPDEAIRNAVRIGQSAHWVSADGTIKSIDPVRFFDQPEEPMS